jgi:hypothetical protein
MLDMIPADPSRREYRQGNTLGEAYRHWFRAKFFGRFRLFFCYDGDATPAVLAPDWVLSSMVPGVIKCRTPRIPWLCESEQTMLEKGQWGLVLSVG